LRAHVASASQTSNHPFTALANANTNRVRRPVRRAVLSILAVRTASLIPAARAHGDNSTPTYQTAPPYS
jgi:hypothetical protein